MNKKRNYFSVALIFLLVLLCGAAYYWRGTSLSLPGATKTSTVVTQPTVLIGTIQAVQGNVITLALQANGSIAKITVNSSTVITNNVLKDAKTLAAGFAEYQALKAKAGGKPFTPPGSSATAPLSLKDLKAGLSVLVTPQVYSTTTATAVSIVVVPAPLLGTPASSTPAMYKEI